MCIDELNVYKIKAKRMKEMLSLLVSVFAILLFGTRGSGRRTMCVIKGNNAAVSRLRR